MDKRHAPSLRKPGRPDQDKPLRAIPPRLLLEHVGFEPDLDETAREAMRSAETWMAAQAKVVIGYEKPFWREAGLSGNAFVTHEQAVLGEIFDACDATSTKSMHRMWWWSPAVSAPGS